jgi:hypothetical protein
MRTFTFPDGLTINADTGETIGQDQPTSLTPQQALSKDQVNVVKPLGVESAMDAVKQLSWGFNSALFALPDAVVEKVARARGVRDEEIPSFVKYFNTGEVAPENMVERFSRSIGKGAGSALPFTGVLGAVARTNALRSPLAADAGVMKRIAKDTLDYIRTNPIGAVTADATFGGIYGALEQSVEEFVDPSQEKDVLKQVVPMLGILAVPSILRFATDVVSNLPSVRIAKSALGPKQPMDVLAEDIAGDPLITNMLQEKALRFPGINWALTKAQRMFAKTAVQKVQEITKPLSDPMMADTQAALKTTKGIDDWLRQHPELAPLNMGDRWLPDAAQASLFPPLLAARNSLTKTLSGEQLKREVFREKDMQNLFGEAFNTLAPKAAMPLDDALRIYWAEDQAALAKSLQQVKDLSESEAIAIADRFKAIDLNDIGDGLRRTVVAQMDGQFHKLKREALDIQATRTSPEGIPIATRTMGEINPTIPAADFEGFAQKMLSKYKLTSNDRIFINNLAPGPVRQIEYHYSAFEKQKKKLIDEEVDRLVKLELSKNVHPEMRKFFEGPTDPTLVSQIDKLKKAVIRGEEEVRIKAPKGTENLFKVDSDKITITAERRNQIFKEAEQSALKDMEDTFRITSPEALDLLGSALRYKNAAFLEYNKRIELGMPRYEAQRVLDVAEGIKRDTEDFVMKSFKNSPQMRDWMDRYESTFKNGYEKFFPMLISKKKATGEPYISSESVVNEALKSGDNIRALNAIMGSDNKMYQKTLTDVMYDQAYRAGVIDKDGLLDTKKYNRWLATRQNVINAMPDSVQATLRDEAVAGQKVLDRVRDMNQRIEDSKDLEFDTLVKKFVRPGADPSKLVANAIADPASMKQLVDRFGQKPENLESLRRQVWLSVRDDLFNPQAPTFLKDFLNRNGKSLGMLYTPQHMDNLRRLSEMQERVFAADSIVGRTSPFLSTDERLKQVLGASVSNLESTARAATIRQISVFHAATSLLARLVSRQQGNVYEAILYKALTDPRYAHELVNATAVATTPAGMKQMANLTAKAGFYLPSLILPAAKVATIEAVEQVLPEEPIPVRPASPVQPAGIPQARPVSQSPASPAPARSLTQSAPARVLPKMPSQPGEGTYQQFANLFPQDFLSPLLQQRAAQGQPEQP